MRKSGVLSVKSGCINTQAWVDYLRRMHPHNTAKHVALRTGYPVRTVEKWLGGSSLPSFAASFALVDAYGTEFLALCLPSSAWVAAAARAERSARIAAEMARLSAELAGLGSLSEAAAP